MKRVIRNGVFESNSSSMHSVSVRGERNLNEYYHPDGVIAIKLDEYGWEGDSLCDFYDKLEYAMSMVLHTEYPGFNHFNKFTVDQDELESLEGYKLLLDAIRKHGDCERIIIKKRNSYVYPYGYIDHQSYEDYSSLADFLKDWNIDAERYLFDDDVVVHIDNDNH